MQDQNSNSPRLVIYYNGRTGLSIQQIASLPYTDINFAFLVPSGPGTSSSDLKLTAKGAWSGLSDLAQNVQRLKSAGKNVLISFGGAIGISHEQYQAYSADINSLVSDIVENWIQPYGFSGVDIDFEDTSAFESSGLYNGIDFLSNLTTALAIQLPETQNTITHAPQTPYWGTTFVDQPYVKIWQNAGQHISWINNQFYNNTGWDGTSALDIQWYDNIAQTCGSQKLTLGMPVAAGAAGQGYIPLAQLITTVIQPLQHKYQGDFGGVMGWELSFDTDNNWGKQISATLGS